MVKTHRTVQQIVSGEVELKEEKFARRNTKQKKIVSKQILVTVTVTAFS